MAVEGEAMLWKRTVGPVKMQRTSSQQLPGHAAPGQAVAPRSNSHHEAGSSHPSQPPDATQDRPSTGTLASAPGGASGGVQVHQDGPAGQQQSPAGTAGRAEPASSSQAGPASTGGSAHPHAQVLPLPGQLGTVCVRNEGPADGTVLNTSADVLVSPLQL